jgi:hypothetical protein
MGPDLEAVSISGNREPDLLLEVLAMGRGASRRNDLFDKISMID